MKNTTTIDLLQELIAGLDRRVPQMHRAGEVAIAAEALALKAAALARIAELKAEMADADTIESAAVSAAGARRM